MPATLDRPVSSSLSYSANRVLLILHQRLRKANLPLLIAFVSALFMFLRALSGAGYADSPSRSESTLVPTLDYSHLVTDESMNGHAHRDAGPGFGEHWARFKDALLACPDDDDMNVVSVGAGLDSDTGIVDAEAVTSSMRSPSSRKGYECLRQRLSGVVGIRPNGPAVKQEDRTFEISLNGIPVRRKGDTANRRTP